MSKHCPPENKYPPKPCPCPEIPGPQGPQGPVGETGPQGPTGPAGPGGTCDCPTFSARILPPPNPDQAVNISTNAWTALPINGSGSYSYNWNTDTSTSPQASTYLYNNIVVASRELTVTAAGNKAIFSAQVSGEGVVVCEVTDIVTNAVALAYHYIKITVIP